MPLCVVHLVCMDVKKYKLFTPSVVEIFRYTVLVVQFSLLSNAFFELLCHTNCTRTAKQGHGLSAKQ